MQNETQLGGAIETRSVAIRTVTDVPSRLQRYLSLDDFQAAAKRKLPRQIYGYYAGAAERGQSFKDNCAALEDWLFVPRTLTDVSQRSLKTSLLGCQYDAPFGIAPMGLSGLSTFEGDVVLARAAKAANIPSVLSATSLSRLEHVAEQGGATWFQAYLPGEDDRIEAMVDRVAAAGYETFVLTADVPVPANRENNVRSGFSIPLRPSLRLAWDGLTHPNWLFNTWAATFLRRGIPHFENMDAFRGPPILAKSVVRAIGNRDQLAWRHVDLIRKRWKGTLVIKGILSSEDAKCAIEAGADAIVLSNHGGRQLDGATSPLRILPEVRAALPKAVILIDGGFRRGTDILKAIALGADFVFIGRPFLFAAAVGGEAAVSHAIRLLKEELDRDLAMLGVVSPQKLNRQMVMKSDR